MRAFYVPFVFLAIFWAFAAGPACLILALEIIDRVTLYKVPEKALSTLKSIVTVALLINLFMLGSEIFTEFYAGSVHAVSWRYLLFGWHGYAALVPWIWTAIVLEVIAAVVFLTPIGRNKTAMSLACAAVAFGIWIEKGMGLIIPAFVPTPIGEIVEYIPTLDESWPRERWAHLFRGPSPRPRSAPRFSHPMRPRRRRSACPS
jgi:molybdopterin-containing oxidoreductase family membrane subunit